MTKTQYKKIGKGALIAGTGAITTYLLAEVPNLDFGQYTPFVAATISIFINAVMKFLEAEKARL